MTGEVILLSAGSVLGIIVVAVLLYCMSMTVKRPQKLDVSVDGKITSVRDSSKRKNLGCPC